MWRLLLLIVCVCHAQWTRLVPDESKRDLAPRSSLSLNGLQNCDTSEDAFFNCVRILFDSNADNSISPDELNARFQQIDFFTANMKTDWIMENADHNHDGLLNMDDWNHANRTIFYRDSTTRLFACFFCRHNGVNMDRV